MSYETVDLRSVDIDVHRQLCVATTSDYQSRFFYRQGLLRDVGYVEACLRHRSNKRNVGGAILRCTRGTVDVAEVLHCKDVRRTNGFDSLQLHHQRFKSIEHESQRCDIQCVERCLREDEAVASGTLTSKSQSH